MKWFGRDPVWYTNLVAALVMVVSTFVFPLSVRPAGRTERSRYRDRRSDHVLEGRGWATGPGREPVQGRDRGSYLLRTPSITGTADGGYDGRGGCRIGLRPDTGGGSGALSANSAEQVTSTFEGDSARERVWLVPSPLEP